MLHEWKPWREVQWTYLHIKQIVLVSHAEKKANKRRPVWNCMNIQPQLNSADSVALCIAVGKCIHKILNDCPDAEKKAMCVFNLNSLSLSWLHCCLHCNDCWELHSKSLKAVDAKMLRLHNVDAEKAIRWFNSFSSNLCWDSCYQHCNGNCTVASWEGH